MSTLESEIVSVTGINPRCDICGKAQQPDDPWNGDTGNHRPCEVAVFTYREYDLSLDDDMSASEEYIEAENRLAILIGHDEPCDYTIKASPPEIQTHLLAIADGNAAQSVLCLGRDPMAPREDEATAGMLNLLELYQAAFGPDELNERLESWAATDPAEFTSRTGLCPDCMHHTDNHDRRAEDGCAGCHECHPPTGASA
jgi:hypothetical protein